MYTPICMCRCVCVSQGSFSLSLSSVGILGMSLSWLFHWFYGLNLSPDCEAHTIAWVISAAFNVLIMMSKSTIKDLKSDPQYSINVTNAGWVLPIKYIVADLLPWISVMSLWFNMLHLNTSLCSFSIAQIVIFFFLLLHSILSMYHFFFPISLNWLFPIFCCLCTF